MEIIMETNLKEYNTRASWSPQQNQLYEGRVATPQSSRQQLPRPQYVGQPQRGVGQKPKAPVKMPKARVLALANTLKRWLHCFDRKLRHVRWAGCIAPGRHHHSNYIKFVDELN